jgi:hypothetical protein
MAYPGQYAATLHGSNAVGTTLSSPYLPIPANGTPNMSATNNPLLSTSSIPLSASYAQSTRINTSSPPFIPMTSSLYTPQATKPISLKTGFTVSISDSLATLQHKQPSQSLISPVCITNIKFIFQLIMV